MSTNYDPSQVGVPYVRVNHLEITWPDSAVPNTLPIATMKQSLAVKLADGSIRTLEKLLDISTPLDFSKGNDPIPLVNPEDASYLGMDTSLNQAMLAVLAVIRQAQIKIQG